jgi:hypothetical protein
MKGSGVVAARPAANRRAQTTIVAVQAGCGKNAEQVNQQYGE